MSGALALAFAGADLGAQSKPVPFVLSPNAGMAGSPATNRGRAAPGQMATRTRPNFDGQRPYYLYEQTVFPRDGFVPSYYIPAVMNNGRVYANFGSGYQVVSNSCSTTYSSGSSVYTSGYPAQQGTYYPVYYPYGPVQGSLGYPQKQYVETYSSNYQTTTCYTSDTQGRLIAYRY